MTFNTEDYDNESTAIRNKCGSDETFVNETLYHFTDFQWTWFADLIENYSELERDGSLGEKYRDEAHEILMNIGKSHLLGIKLNLDAKLQEKEMQDAD